MTPKSYQRSRLIYALAVTLVIAAGLLWRSDLLPLSPFLAKYGGNALWSLMMFLGVGFLFPSIATSQIAFIALVISFSTEFLQLYHAHWIDSIRSTKIGALVLGSTFNAPDLLAYVIGIGSGVLAECLCGNALQKIRQNSPVDLKN